MLSVIPTITLSHSSSIGTLGGSHVVVGVVALGGSSASHLSSVVVAAGEFGTGAEPIAGVPSPQSSSAAVTTLGAVAVEGVSQPSSDACGCCRCVKEPRFENPPPPSLPPPRPPTETNKT